MLDWLKTILGDAYTEEIDKKVSEEIGKAFVARADFNTLNQEKKSLDSALKERDKQLETLKSSTGDVDALKEQIASLQAANKTATEAHAAEIKRLKIDTAVELALSTAKAKNTKAVKALLDLEKAELAEDGTVKGLTEQIKALSEAADSSFLFEQGKKTKDFKGFTPGESGDKPPTGGKTPEAMTYEELCAYLAENPNITL